MCKMKSINLGQEFQPFVQKQFPLIWANLEAKAVCTYTEEISCITNSGNTNHRNAKWNVMVRMVRISLNIRTH